jgi:hypothetical protein
VSERLQVLTPEERKIYRAKCMEVGRCLYGIYGNHFQRWEDSPQSVKDKYAHMAHMARVWWNGANHIPIVFDTGEKKE